MKKARNLTLPAPGYLLSEASHTQLQALRNHCLLMADLACVNTLEEERFLLQLPRSVLAQCLEMFATQLADVLDATQKLDRIDHGTRSMH